MKTISPSVFLVVIIFSMVGLFGISPAVSAAPASQVVSTPINTDAATEPIDVVVLLDDSGSMATCWPWPQDRPPFNPPCGSPSPNLPSDPAALRYSAARLLLQLVDEQDRVAVVRFDSDAAGIGNLGTLQPVGSDENRKQLIDSLQPPESYFERGYTRIDLGLDKAIQLLEEGREPGRSQYLLLLTDGEPSEQAGVPDQKPRIIEQFGQLAADDVLTFPVVLCNPTAGCAGDFLREDLAQLDLVGKGVNEAATAPDLLRIFSELLTDMKPDRSIITERDGAGALQTVTRDAHGARQLAYVTSSGNLLSVKRDGTPTLPVAALRDPNIDVNLVAGSDLTAGRWTANTLDRNGFVVVQADSYPLLLNPPPSVANSPASTRYYPEGKTPLLIARGTGPGINEPLFLEDQGEFGAFGTDGHRALLPVDLPSDVQIQLGGDQEPLQLVRTFRIESRPDLPRAEVFSPIGDSSGLLQNGHLPLEVGFGSGDVLDMAATVYVSDESLDEAGNGKLVYQATMQCADRLCTDNNFMPGDGRSYRITYVVQGQQDGIRFSDWVRTDLGLSPAVYLRGLPAELDLANMPPEGWPIELSSGTIDPIGALVASAVLRAVDSDEPVATVSLNFSEEVPEEGSLQALLKVDGLQTLRPGDYAGEISLSATSPSGLPMDVEIRPGATLPIAISVPRPLAQVDEQVADFGQTQFETSPNFRLNQNAEVPLSFVGSPFDIAATMVSSSCADITIEAGALQARDGVYILPLSLTSTGPIQPATCTGAISLSGPDGDYDVSPSTVEWRTRVDEVEWSLAGSDLNLGDLQDAGARATGTLLLRFNGQTPFVVQMEGVTANGETDEGVVTLTEAELEMIPVEITDEPNEAGLYEVPISFVVRSRIPNDPLSGSFYSGDLAVSIAGLPGDVQTAGLSFRSPSVLQRYVLPIVGPIYGMPQALLSIPLTLLLLLIIVARIRSRGIDDDEIEEAAMAAAMQMNGSMNADAAAAAQQPFVPVSVPNNQAVWGSSEWGMPSLGSGDSPSSTSRSSDDIGDPWNASW